MLNRRNAPSICRFLADVSLDRELPLSRFSWRTAACFPFLPRVQYGRLVLSLAEWKLDIEDLYSIPGNLTRKRTVPTAAAWYASIQTWRRRWQVPRYVYLMQGDNRLLLDLEQEPHVMELFYAATANGKTRVLSLQEALPGPEHAWIVGRDGHHLNECIFQLVRQSAGAVPSSVNHRPVVPVYQAVTAEERLKVPGSDWLFCKLYMPAQQHNDCLVSHLKQLLSVITQRCPTTSWFFLRYADPQPHIRLRFQAPEDVIGHMVIPIVTAWARSMQRAGLLQTFCIDSYDREIERYGGHAAIATAEAIFSAESEADLQLILLSEREALAGLTLPDIAVLTASLMLSAFGLDDAQQIAWAKARYGSPKAFIQEYRQDRRNILALVHTYRGTAPMPQDVRRILEQLRDKLTPLARQYRRLETDGLLTIPVERILDSFVHMHINRLLGMDRAQEQRTLTYLWRILTDLPKWQQGTRKTR